MKNQIEQVTSLTTTTTTRLSPLAKPFTINRSPLQPTSSSLFECYPFLESPKEADFDGYGGYSPLGHGGDSHESLFAKGSDGVDSTMVHKVKKVVDGLNPCLTESDGVFKNAIVAEDILSNCKGAIHAAGECSSFCLSDCKVRPLKLSTNDMSTAKNTLQNQSSKNLGESDSDVDSPCWKGTMARGRTPIENSRSIQISSVEKATERHNSLNPLAPQFFPGIGYVTDDFQSTNSCAPVATNLLSGEDILIQTVMAESQPELTKGDELKPSSNTCGREKVFDMCNDPKNSSVVDPVLYFPCMAMQSSSRQHYSMPKGEHETVGVIDNFVKGTKDPMVSSSMSDLFHAKSHSLIPTLSISSSQAGDVPDLLKTFEGVSRSLLKSSKPDVGKMISAMHVLSELLVQASMDGADSNSKHGCDAITIKQIINNLNGFSTKRCDLRIPTPDSTPADNPCCLDRSFELSKGLDMTSIETVSDPSLIYSQNDCMGKNRVFKMIGHSGQRFLASSGGDQYKGNEIAQLQVIRRSLGKTLDFDKQMHPETLLFLNLWLDSEAERCYKKYRTYHCLMEAGVDVNCTTVAVFPFALKSYRGLLSATITDHNSYNNILKKVC
ncbi:hypothetical protein Fmac_008930 [Flemingia macrophylla]|uniref:Uncharacterized protein n=1 Tax=Flemingia macrophylla TaxID=520843 RepID=A0ABD1MYS8_9FABA